MTTTGYKVETALTTPSRRTYPLRLKMTGKGDIMKDLIDQYFFNCANGLAVTKEQEDAYMDYAFAEQKRIADEDAAQLENERNEYADYLSHIGDVKNDTAHNAGNC